MNLENGKKYSFVDWRNIKKTGEIYNKGNTFILLRSNLLNKGNYNINSLGKGGVVVMKSNIILFMVLLILLIYTGQDLAAESIYNLNNKYLYYTYINDAFFNSYGDFNLTDFVLRLPEKEFNLFSPEAQNELLNLAALYANQTIKVDKEFNLTAESEGIIENNLNISKPEEELVPDSLVLTPLPGVLVNADFKQEKEELTIEENTSISLQYWMNNRTLIRAEYGVASRKWWDIKDITLDDEASIPGDTDDNNSGTDDPDNDDSNNDDNTNDDPDSVNDDDIRQEAVFNKETNEKSRLGISYKTSDRITISADYLDEGEDGISDFSTILGVEYIDQNGLLKYHYQLDFDEMDFGTIRKMESGVELGIKDLAIFNASYQLLNPGLLEDQLKESIWDFGLDFNLNDISSLSLGYQLKSNKDQNLELEDSSEKESNIKAQLEIEF